MRIRKLVAKAVLVGGMLLGAAPCPLAAQEGPAVPLEEPRVALTAANAAAALSAAQRAQELGLPSVAITLYRELLATPGADRVAITLPLATALLDAGRAVEAEQALQAAPGGRGFEWRLRLGLAAAQQRHWDEAREQANSINVDQLQRPDRAWFFFLQAVLADSATPRDARRANDNYILAQREAPSEMALATFLAAGLRVRLSLVNYSAQEIEQARQGYLGAERRGDRQKYSFAGVYATMRYGAGDRAGAVAFLREVIIGAPAGDAQAVDELRRLLGMIGDRSRGGEGRVALNRLLETGSVPELQRQALVILARDSAQEPERTLFREELDKIIGSTPKSAILDGILLVRAQLALGDPLKDFATAERRANELKENFPGSPLRPHAFAVLASSAWEQKRYRVAADNARQAREALAALPGAAAPTEAKVIAQSIAELRVLEAEARFRAQDYRLAADAYAAALRAAPAGIPPGDLMFQRALASIRADSGDPRVDLSRIVDELESDPRFDPANRWEAEWSLARGLRVQGKTEAALERVSRLLASTEAKSDAITPELRARMSWLQARLSFDADKPELTLRFVEGLDAATAAAPADLRDVIRSTAALLKAQAQLRLAKTPADIGAATETLAALRSQFPTTDAAIYSYVVEASYFAETGRDQIQRAQTALNKLVDDPRYQQSQYVPYALFQLALLSERLGKPEDANRLIERLVNMPTASPDLVFQARLKQGDLFRTANQFSPAQRAYEDLVNNPRYAQRPDAVFAQLRLAECHNAQSSTDPSGTHTDLAQSLFEELLYRVSAPADVRVEAGYNLGKLLERRGQLDKARDVWWRGVLQPFLIDSPPGGDRRATEPFWLAKTLNDLGMLLERQEAIDEARRVFVLLRDSKLGYGEAIAVEALQRLGVPASSGNKS